MDRVLVAGHVNWDVTLRVDRLPPADGEATIRSKRQSGGGSAANVAAGLARLGVDVALFGSVGDDEHGERIKRSLGEIGVDCASVHAIPEAETACKYLLVDDEGTVSVLGNDGANEALGPDAVDPELVRSVDHVHLTSQRPATASELATVAREAGCTVSFDPGRRLAHRSYDGTIARADVIFLTGREAEVLRGREEGALAFGERTVVVTEGSDGAVVHGPDATTHHAGFDVTPVDTAGAGDAFAAGFLTKWWQGAPDRHALRFANACGAVAATSEGAQTELPDDRIEAFLEGADDPV